VSRVLLADDSPHAQRMGERILREEGFQVVTVADGNAALLRLAEFDPDVLLLDVALPARSGYQLCEYVKGQPEHRHRRVVLLSSLLDAVDPAEAARVGADATLQKPLEASAVIETVRRLAALASAPPPSALAPADRAEMVRAAVTLALDAALPALIDELTQRMLVVLERKGDA
jgi:CheY-like chemotaxis protein